MLVWVQNQRKLDMETDARRRVEGMLKDKEKEIDMVRRKGQEINRDSAQSNEKLVSVEKAVSFIILICLYSMPKHA
jgi:hypothetical protein